MADLDAIRAGLPSGAAVALLDWDNTLARGFLVQRWSAFLAQQGVVRGDYAETISNLVRRYVSGSLNYEAFAADVEASFLRWEPTLHPSRARTLGEEFAHQDMASLYEWTRPLLRELESRNWTPVIVSGAPEGPLAAYGRRLTFRHYFAWAAEGPPGSRRLKWGNTALRELKGTITTEAQGRARVEFAMGDSASDVPMLEAGRLAVRIENGQMVDCGVEGSVWTEFPTLRGYLKGGGLL